MEEEDVFDLETIEQDLLQFQQDEVVKDALATGIDLRSYAQEIDKELHGLQTASIPEFIAEAPVTAQLYDEMRECDEILQSMEEALQKFQLELGGISDDIKQLQSQSLSMSTKLKNRREVETQLALVLKNIIVPEKVVTDICDAEVNESYVEYVRAFDEKMLFCHSQEPVGEFSTPPSDILAVQDIEPQFEKLRLKVISKSRQYLLNQIAQLKKPKTNIQIMQQSTLVKYQALFRFLVNHAPAVVQEIKTTYIDTISRIYYTSFKTYYSNLLKLQMAGPGKEDLIGADATQLETLTKNPSSNYSLKMSQLNNDEAIISKLTLRESKLGKPDAPQRIPHIVQSTKEQLYFEEIFRSVQKHLVHTAASEYLFLVNFFDVSTTDMFNKIFARTLSLCLENLENYLYTSFDHIALMMMIRVTQQNRQMMPVDCLNGYFDHVNMLLWPQFKKLFDTNVKSMTTWNHLAIQSLGYQAHYVSLRYGEFSSSVYAMGQCLHPPDEMLHHNLVKMRQTYLALLSSLIEASSHKGLHTEKGRAIFYINNFEAVLGSFSKLSHEINPSDCTEFEELLARSISKYIEEELCSTFAHLIAFLRDVEDGKPRTNTDLFKILDEFSKSWKSNLTHLNASIQHHFESPVTSREVMKQLLSQFLLYYSRFQDAAKKVDPSVQSQGQMVVIQEIMQEIKTYGKD